MAPMTEIGVWPEFNWIPFGMARKPATGQIVWITNGSLVVPAICGDVWHEQQVTGDIYSWRWRYNFRFPWQKEPWCNPADLAPDITHWCPMYPPLPVLPKG